MFEAMMRVRERERTGRMDGVLPSVYGARRDAYREDVSGMKLIRGMNAAKEDGRVEVNHMDLVYWCCACCKLDRTGCPPATFLLSVESEPLTKVLSNNVWDVLHSVCKTKPPCIEEMWGIGAGKRIVVALRVEEGVTSYAAVVEDKEGDEMWCDKGRVMEGLEEVEMELIDDYAEMIKSCAVVVDTRKSCFEAVVRDSVSAERLRRLYVSSDAQKKEVESLSSLASLEKERADWATRELEEKRQLLSSLISMKRKDREKLTRLRWRVLAQGAEKKEGKRAERKAKKRAERKKKGRRAEGGLRRIASLLEKRASLTRRVASLRLLLSPPPLPVGNRFSKLAKAARLRREGARFASMRKVEASVKQWKGVAGRLLTLKTALVGDQAVAPVAPVALEDIERAVWKRLAACLMWKERAAACVRYAREVTKAAIKSEAAKQIEAGIVESIRDKVVKEVRETLKPEEGRPEVEKKRNRPWKGKHQEQPPQPPEHWRNPDQHLQTANQGWHHEQGWHHDQGWNHDQSWKNQAHRIPYFNPNDYSSGMYCSIPESHRRMY